MKIENLLQAYDFARSGEHSSRDLRGFPVMRGLFEHTIAPKLIKRKRRLVELLGLDDDGRTFVESEQDILRYVARMDYGDPIRHAYTALGLLLRRAEPADEKVREHARVLGDCIYEGGRTHIYDSLQHPGYEGKLMWTDHAGRPARPGRLLARVIPDRSLWETSLDTVVSGLARAAKQRILISVNPFDMYLMSSDNRESFSTCHAPGKLYEGGPWQYMADEVSLVAKVLYQDSTQFPYEQSGRVMVFVPDDKHIILNRGYGSMCGNHELSRVITSHLTDRIGGSWTAKNDLHFHWTKHNRTAAYGDTPIERASIHNDVLEGRSVGDALPFVSFSPPVCVSCGDDYERSDTYEHRRECEDCNPGGQPCYTCGCHVERGAEYTDDDGDVFCEDCYSERYTTCENCGDETNRDDTYTVEGDSWCSSCYSRHARSCDHCDESYDTRSTSMHEVHVTRTTYYSDFRTDVRVWCEGCVDGDAEECGKCGVIVYHANNANLRAVHTDEGDVDMCHGCREDAEVVLHGNEYYTPQVLEPILGAIRFEEMIQIMLEEEVAHA